MESKYIDLVINRLTQAQYDSLKTNNQISEEELYVITDHDDLFYYKTQLYTKDELNTKFSEVSTSLTQLETTINQNISTKIAEITEDITELETTVNQNIASQISTLETELSEFKTDASETYATKEELSNYSPVAANPKLTGAEEILDSITIDDVKYKVYPEGTIEFDTAKSTDPLANTLRSIKVGSDIWNIPSGGGGEGGGADLSDYYTSAQTNEAINTAISNLIDAAPEAYDTLKEIANYIESDADTTATLLATINGKADKTEVYTMAEANSKFATKSEIPTIPNMADYYTKTETDQVIDSKIESVTGLDNYYKKDEIDAKVENINAVKQDLLISGTNIKTINGSSILGSGDIEIIGGSGGGSNVIANPELDGDEEILESIQIEETKYTLHGQDMTFSETSSEDPEAKILKTITIGTDDWKVDKGSIVTPNIELTGDEPVLESVKIDDATFTLKGEEMIFSENAVQGATILRNIRLGDDDWAIPAGGSGGSTFIFRDWTV